METVWQRLGFRDSPYGPEHLPSSTEGSRLLVSRDAEVSKIHQLLRSTKRHIALEGENGVGKTSVVNVACYRALAEFRNGQSKQLFLPVRRTFQLTPTSTPESFRREVLLEVAQSIISQAEELNLAGRAVPDLGPIKTWLGSPIITGGGVGLTFAGFGGSANLSQGANTSAGFTEAGFALTITSWLRDCFPSNDVGAFVAVIDNLELLETSQAARTLLEGLRDEVLNLPGTRWVLCGARGIVRTVASSPRLEGVLNEPIDVNPLPNEAVPELINRRIEVFSSGNQAVAPVDADGFRVLYDALHSNLRNALRFAEDFSIWFSDQNPPPSSSSARLEALRAWLDTVAERYLSDTKSVGGAAWKVFDALVRLGGSCSPQDYEQFGYDTYQALRPQTASLENAQLVLVTRDDANDQRRKTISLTPRGWIVWRARAVASQTITTNSTK